MPRYQFRVMDPEGKARRGTIEARSVSDARTLIEKRGFTIIELKDAGEPEPTVQVQSPRGTARYHVGPAAPREYRPSFGERLGALLPAPSITKAGLALLAAVGLLWMVSTWRSTGPKSSPGRTAKRAAEQQLNEYKIQLAGHVAVQGSESLGDVQIVAEFPDIPYQQTFEWAKLDHPAHDTFVTKLEFKTPRKARVMNLKAVKPGLGEVRLPEIRLRPGGGEYPHLSFTIVPKR